MTKLEAIQARFRARADVARRLRAGWLGYIEQRDDPKKHIVRRAVSWHLRWRKKGYRT